MAAFASPANALTVTAHPITFPAVTLDGSNQVVQASSAVPWNASALADTGWNVTVSSTDLVSGALTLPVENFAIRLTEPIICVAGDCIHPPTSTQTAFASLDTPRGILSAPETAGQGSYDFSPEFRLTIPASSYASSYSATLTATIGVGP